ncbi:GL22474 [Drosophila persimilis]|uniref:GL22474 n=1 Tax=Drosophila persimilis TaxID=7234 RepID=B4H1H7_DROPE|nr:GL22474 [Drosophila persimilis]
MPHLQQQQQQQVQQWEACSMMEGQEQQHVCGRGVIWGAVYFECPMAVANVSATGSGPRPRLGLLLVFVLLNCMRLELPDPPAPASPPPSPEPTSIRLPAKVRQLTLISADLNASREWVRQEATPDKCCYTYTTPSAAPSFHLLVT